MVNGASFSDPSGSFTATVVFETGTFSTANFNAGKGGILRVAIALSSTTNILCADRRLAGFKRTILSVLRAATGVSIIMGGSFIPSTVFIFLVVGVAAATVFNLYKGSRVTLSAVRV